MKLYTQPSCGPCKVVKKFIDENDISIEVVEDIMLFPKGIRAVPALAVDGQFLTGDTPIIKRLKEAKDAE